MFGITSDHHLALPGLVVYPTTEHVWAPKMNAPRAGPVPDARHCERSGYRARSSEVARPAPLPDNRIKIAVRSYAPTHSRSERTSSPPKQKNSSFALPSELCCTSSSFDRTRSLWLIASISSPLGPPGTSPQGMGPAGMGGGGLSTIRSASPIVSPGRYDRPGGESQAGQQPEYNLGKYGQNGYVQFDQEQLNRDPNRDRYGQLRYQRGCQYGECCWLSSLRFLSSDAVCRARNIHELPCAVVARGLSTEYIERVSDLP